ncbi:hypothetical protein BDZ94DRAFT_1242534 [Collybia nuda]|uniref:Uncharacterized protein n=1 Tax=Collybia nuda TaxID=64659 RepID=A0A9P5YIA3_9AGAR|nr:hypothetical protein BDZ94DRAFT_1242534 [Collybia nuda]
MTQKASSVRTGCSFVLSLQTGEWGTVLMSPYFLLWKHRGRWLSTLILTVKIKSY